MGDGQQRQWLEQRTEVCSGPRVATPHREVAPIARGPSGSLGFGACGSEGRGAGAAGSPPRKRTSSGPEFQPRPGRPPVFLL